MINQPVSVYQITKGVRQECHANYQTIPVIHHLAVLTLNVQYCLMDFQSVLVYLVMSKARILFVDVLKHETLANRVPAESALDVIQTKLHLVSVQKILLEIHTNHATVTVDIFHQLRMFSVSQDHVDQMRIVLLVAIEKCAIAKLVLVVTHIWVAKIK